MLRLATLFVLFLASCTVERRETYEPASLTLADVRVAGSLPIYVARERGFFANYGLDVRLQSAETGRQALAHLGSDADIATVADVAATLAIIEGKDLRVTAMLGLSDASNAIVWRKDRGIGVPADLRGKRVGVTPGTTAEYFLDVFLLLNRIPRDAVTSVPLPRDNLVPMLREARVDAVATWNPLTADALAVLGPLGDKIQARDYFDTFYLLVATSDYIRKNPGVVRRLLLALRDATEYIEGNRDEAVRILRKYVPDRAERPLEGYHFDVTLEHALVVNFWNMTAWAKTAGYRVPHGIDFIARIYVDGLESIDPALVTILR